MITIECQVCGERIRGGKIRACYVAREVEFVPVHRDCEGGVLLPRPAPTPRAELVQIESLRPEPVERPVLDGRMIVDDLYEDEHDRTEEIPTLEQVEARKKEIRAEWTAEVFRARADTKKRRLV